MLYLLLKEDWQLVNSIDASYAVWMHVKQFEAGTLQEAIDQIPSDREAKYQLYELKSEPTAVTVRKPDKFEKVWGQPKKEYGYKATKLKANVVLREGDEDLPLGRCEHSVISPNRRKYCSTCRDNAAAHF